MYVAQSSFMYFLYLHFFTYYNITQRREAQLSELSASDPA